MRIRYVALVFAASCALTAPIPGLTAGAAAPMPDVGRLEVVKVTTSGFGGSASEAVAEAIKLAILQVNGASVQMSTLSVKYGLDVTLGQDSASLRAQSFTDAVRTRSGGVIQNFRVVSLEEPSDKKARFKATIEAGIAKFTAPQDLQKIKLVIAPLHVDGATIAVGDTTLPASSLAETLHQHLVDALVNTGRFAVLDRDFGPEIQQELDMVASGNAPSAETAKLGQAVSADVVLSVHVTSFAYERHARALRTSDRELVSYSGGWAVSQKLVNVATRQLMISDTLRGQAPSTAPTTLGRPVDSTKVLDDMTNDLAGQVVTAVLRKTFPITVVSRDGTNVVLSQGGQALREGARYMVVSMGKELKDPQTGQSLGMAESPCCELAVDRVTPNLSYGHLEKVVGSLDALPVGGLQLRAEVKPVPVAQNMPTVPAMPPPSAGTPAPAPVAPMPPKASDDKW